MEEKVELEILGLTYSEHFQPTYILILKEKYGTKRLPIAIGKFEANAIGMKLENLQPKRPITHDLIYNMFKALGINVLEVLITKVEEDIFYGEIVIEHNQKIFRIDSRPSDAIALAVRFDCPIYAYKSVIDKEGIDIEKLKSQNFNENIESSTPASTENREENYLRSLSLEDLKRLMQNAIDKENYELASKIRDEIKRRQGQL